MVAAWSLLQTGHMQLWSSGDREPRNGGSRSLTHCVTLGTGKWNLLGWWFGCSYWAGDLRSVCYSTSLKREGVSWEAWVATVLSWSKGLMSHSLWVEIMSISVCMLSGGLHFVIWYFVVDFILKIFVLDFILKILTMSEPKFLRLNSESLYSFFNFANCYCYYRGLLFLT